MTGRRIAAGTGSIALATYAVLKAAWGLGSDVGIENRAAFDSVFGGLSQVEVALATWGTVGLAAAGAALLLLVTAGGGTPLGRGKLGRFIRGSAWIVSIPLGLYSVAALVATVARLSPSPLAAWVNYLTYGAFLAYSAALAWLLWTRRGSRGFTR